MPSSLESDQQLIGTPPIEKMAFFRSRALLGQIPEVFSEINYLKRRVDELENCIRVCSPAGEGT